VTAGLDGTGRLGGAELDGAAGGDPGGVLGGCPNVGDIELSGRGGRHVDRGGGRYGCQVATVRAGAGYSPAVPEGVGETAGSG
jgi:hypothetical protein